MSNTRDILIDSHEPIERVAEGINAVIHPDSPLRVQTVSSPRGSWKIAEGKLGLYPLVLVDATHLDVQTGRGFGWNLELHCRAQPGEAYSSFEARCDEDGRRIMKRIGGALRTRCFALSNLQAVLGEYP